MNINLLPSKRVFLLETKHPVSVSASTITTGWISAKDYKNYLASIHVGVLGSSATVDAKLEQATDSSGTGAKDVTGKAITQLTKAGSDDNKVAFINLSNKELDVANEFDYFRLSITVGTAASVLQAAVYGLDPTYSGTQSTLVDEVVS